MNKNKKQTALLARIVKDLEAYRKGYPRNYYQHLKAADALDELKELLKEERRGYED